MLEVTKTVLTIFKKNGKYTFCQKTKKKYLQIPKCLILCQIMTLMQNNAIFKKIEIEHFRDKNSNEYACLKIYHFFIENEFL